MRRGDEGEDKRAGGARCVHAIVRFVMRARVIPLQYDSQGVEKHLTLKSLLKILVHVCTVRVGARSFEAGKFYGKFSLPVIVSLRERH